MHHRIAGAKDGYDGENSDTTIVVYIGVHVTVEGLDSPARRTPGTQK